MTIIREKETRMVYSEPLVNGLFLQMLSLLLREYTINNVQEKNKNRDVAWKVQEYLSQNLDKNISLDDISHHIHASIWRTPHSVSSGFTHRTCKISADNYTTVHRNNCRDRRLPEHLLF